MKKSHICPCLKCLNTNQTCNFNKKPYNNNLAKNG